MDRCPACGGAIMRSAFDIACANTLCVYRGGFDIGPRPSAFVRGLAAGAIATPVNTAFVPAEDHAAIVKRHIAECDSYRKALAEVDAVLVKRQGAPEAFHRADLIAKTLTERDEWKRKAAEWESKVGGLREHDFDIEAAAMAMGAAPSHSPEAAAFRKRMDGGASDDHARHVKARAALRERLADPAVASSVAEKRAALDADDATGDVFGLTGAEVRANRLMRASLRERGPGIARLPAPTPRRAMLDESSLADLLADDDDGTPLRSTRAAT